MIDTPLPVRAIEGAAAGQAKRGLPEAALVVVAQEVIRRLAGWAEEMAQRHGKPPPQRIEPDIATLCARLVGLDPGAAAAMIRDAHREGATHEELCVYHIGAAARRLGWMWDNDRVTYADMAVAAGRMLGILRDLRDMAPPVVPRRGRYALFASVPGEDHVLGVTMAADLFREDGWDIDLRLGDDEDALVAAVTAHDYPIVGLSAASIARVRALARTIVALRVAQPKLLIFVGGYLARLEPDIALRVGADAAGHDIPDCKTEMDRLHDMLPMLSMVYQPPSR